MATVEELRVRASAVIETLHTILDKTIPFMRLYPELSGDIETSLESVVRFYRALETWRVPETPRDVENRRMRENLELMSRLGREADVRLQHPDPDTPMEDLAAWGVMRQFGELADRGLGNDWPAREEDDADLLA